MCDTSLLVNIRACMVSRGLPAAIAQVATTYYIRAPSDLCVMETLGPGMRKHVGAISISEFLTENVLERYHLRFLGSPTSHAS